MQDGRAVRLLSDKCVCIEVKLVSVHLVMLEWTVFKSQWYIFVTSVCVIFRSDTPLIYKAVPSWFVRVEQMQENLLNSNNMTYWWVDHVTFFQDLVADQNIRY